MDLLQPTSKNSVGLLLPATAYLQELGVQLVQLVGEPQHDDVLRLSHAASSQYVIQVLTAGEGRGRFPWIERGGWS